VDLLPIADGGDGTIDALHCAIGGSIRHSSVEGPDGRTVVAPWLVCGELGIIELASASGLSLLQGRLNPIHAHTRGTGQLIKACIELGIKRIVLAVGGSASTDGGAGLLAALGAEFFKAGGEQIALGASELHLITACNLAPARELVSARSVAVACDVDNPLLGPQGAAAIYGPQKGATPEMISFLEAGLTHYADVVEGACGRRLRSLPGTGAAGGTGFGVVCGLSAEILSGFDFMSSLLELESRIETADLVITGEGALDEQSIFGKAIGKLAAVCRHKRKRLIAIPATASSNIDWQRLGIERVICSSKPGKKAELADVEEATLQALKELEEK
jgi:glycerate kinase